MSRIIKAVSDDKVMYFKGYYQVQKHLNVNAGLVSNIANKKNERYHFAHVDGVKWTFEIVEEVPEGFELIEHKNISHDKNYQKNWYNKNKEKMRLYQKNWRSKKLNQTESHQNVQDDKPAYNATE